MQPTPSFLNEKSSDRPKPGPIDTNFSFAREEEIASAFPLRRSLSPTRERVCDSFMQLNRSELEIVAMHETLLRSM